MSTPNATSSPLSGPYQVVARRYRPPDFEHLVGQEHVAQALSNAITTGRIGHAYLFTGARGVGKTSSARIFAKALNCIHGPTPHPCNVCEICQGIGTGEDVDVLEIDGASNRGIDEIRQVRQNVSITPSRAKFKIYIIDEVHMLTQQAFNALLKTLEEPPGHVKFIFCTTEPTKIPITILSRCQRFDFAGIDSGAIAGRLAEIAAKEQVTAEEGVFETLARRAAGSMRDAQSLLEQLLSFAPEHIKLSDVHDMLGTANDQRLFHILEALLAADGATVFEELDTAAEEGVDFGTLVEQIMGIFRDLLVVSSDGGAKLLLFCDPARYDDLRRLGREFGIQRLLAALQILDHTHGRMRYSTQGRILMELALARIAHLGQLQSIASLIEQCRTGAIPTQLTLPAAPPGSVPTAPASPVSPTPAAPPPTPVSRQPAPQVRSVPEPPQPVAEAIDANEPVDLATLDDAKATEIWRQAVAGISGMLASQAGKFVKVEFQQPDAFAVFFPTEMLRASCERGIAMLQNALKVYTGHTIRIFCRLAAASGERAPGEHAPATATAPQGPVQPAAPTPTTDRRAAIRQTATEPIVAKAQELFGGTLIDVQDS